MEWNMHIINKIMMMVRGFKLAIVANMWIVFWKLHQYFKNIVIINRNIQCLYLEKSAAREGQGGAVTSP